MPSGITHIILSKFALDRIKDVKGGMPVAVLRANPGAFLLGSVAPDLPYMSIFDGRIFESETEVADDLHYRKTNEVPVRGLGETAAIVRSGGDPLHANALFSFYVGHCSHLIADGIIHPYVRDKVGDYEVAKKPHRVLEMKLDILLARRLYGTEVNEVSFQDELDWMRDCSFRDQIFTSFANGIRDVYGHDVKPEYVRGWASAIENVFGLAEGNFPKWYRDLMGDAGVAFKNYADLAPEANELAHLGMPIDAAKHGLSSNFSGQKEVRYFEDVVEKYLSTFPAIVLSAYEAVFEAATDVSSLLPAINLDTGRSLADARLSQTPVLWA